MSFVLNEKDVQKLKSLIKNHKLKPGPLMPTLHDAQNIFGCIPIEVQKIISEELNEPVAKINGIVTFYSHFTLTPKGEHTINVCLGTACYVRGSQLILDAICQMLKIKPGETTPDGRFTLDNTRCIGACGLSPVFKIDDKVYGSATPEIAREAIQNIIKSYNP